MCNGVQSATEASVGQRTVPGVFPEAAGQGPAPDPAQETQVLSGITDAQSRGTGVETELTPVGSWNTLTQAPCPSVTGFCLREPNRKASPSYLPLSNSLYPSWTVQRLPLDSVTMEPSFIL